MQLNAYLIEILLPLIVIVPITMALVMVFFKNNKISYILTNLTTLFLVVFSLLILYFLKDNNVYHYFFGSFIAPFGIEYKVDYLNAVFIVLISVIAFLVSLYNYKLTIYQVGFNRYYLFNVVFLLNIAGFMGIIATNDAFNLFVFIEISALTSYILISMSSTKKAYLSAFNYLIIGTIGASFYVFGIGFLYVLYGTLNITTLALSIQQASFNYALAIGMLFIFVGLIIKIAVFPLAFWLPSVYKNAPVSATAFFSGVSSKTSIYVFIKIIIIMLGINNSIKVDTLLQITAVLALCSSFVFGLWATKTNNFKELLALSSLSQIGFIMLALAINTTQASSAALLLIVAHALVKVSLFLLAGILQVQFGTTNLNKLQGVGHKIPVTFFAIVFGVFSLIALPPSLMFFAKLQLIYALISSQLYVYTALVLVASVISLGYGFKVLFHLWQTSIKPTEQQNTNIAVNNVPFYMYLAVFIIIAINITLTFMPNVVFNIINIISNNSLQI